MTFNAYGDTCLIHHMSLPCQACNSVSPGYPRAPQSPAYPIDPMPANTAAMHALAVAITRLAAAIEGAT